MNPATGTFLSVDPVVADYADPQSYNAYAYARSNPVNVVDPTGMCGIGPLGIASWGCMDAQVAQALGVAPGYFNSSTTFTASENARQVSWEAGVPQTQATLAALDVAFYEMQADIEARFAEFAREGRLEVHGNDPTHRHEAVLKPFESADFGVEVGVPEFTLTNESNRASDVEVQVNVPVEGGGRETLEATIVTLPPRHSEVIRVPVVPPVPPLHTPPPTVPVHSYPGRVIFRNVTMPPTGSVRVSRGAPI